MRPIPLIILLFLSTKLVGQDIFFGPHSASTWIIGNGQAACHQGGLYTNPASTVNRSQAHLELTAGNRYSQSSLFDGQIQYIQPSHLGHFSGAVRYFGDQAFSEQMVSLGYAKSLSTKVSLGIATHFQRQQLNIYGNRNNLFLSLGVQAELVQSLEIGFSVFQSLSPPETENEKVINVWSSGFGYSFTDQTRLYGAVMKESQQDPTVQVGIEFSLFKDVLARLGLDTQSESFGIGIGIPVQSFRVDVGTQLHTVLGFSPVLGIQRQF